MTTTALIVAAGRGTRMASDIPKQYQILSNKSVLLRSIQPFLDHQDISRIIVVIHRESEDRFEAIKYTIEDSAGKLLPPVHGGTSRAESTLNGLRALREHNPKRILIHDAARPFVTDAVITRVIKALDSEHGAVPTLPAVDSMRLSDDTGTLGKTVPRDGIRRAQTPQGFRFDTLLPILESAEADGSLAALSDEAEAFIAAGRRVVSVEGDPMNFKLTIPEDFTMAERLLAEPDIRTGQGYDVHAFEEGDHVILCGIKIPHDKGLSGHSDADVGLHTITDALLGAVAEGDIGRHFPPSDPQWKGTDSAVFLKRAVEIVAERGYAISNIDLTLICEEPKVTPHAPAMISRVAEICALDSSRVSIKATTSERLGFTGRREGIAGTAVATVMRQR